MTKVSFEGKTTEDILKEMEALAGEDLRFPLFDAMKVAIQTRTVSKLCDQIAALGGNFVRQSNSLKENLDNFRNSLDKFRESNEQSSRSMKRWTIVLAGATIVLAISTMVLALK